MVARRLCTRRWWADERADYELFTSAFVLGELQDGDYPNKTETLALVADIPLLEVVPDVEAIAGVYMTRKLMPQSDIGDAYHVAMASYYGVHFLLTWNCRHLANANKVRHLQVVNAELGLSVPIITTPDLLLTEVDDDER